MEEGRVQPVNYLDDGALGTASTDARELHIKNDWPTHMHSVMFSIV